MSKELTKKYRGLIKRLGNYDIGHNWIFNGGKCTIVGLRVYPDELRNRHIYEVDVKCEISFRNRWASTRRINQAIRSEVTRNIPTKLKYIGITCAHYDYSSVDYVRIGKIEYKSIPQPQPEG